MSFRKYPRTSVAHQRFYLIAVGVYLVALSAWVAVLNHWLPMPEMTTPMATMARPGVPEMLAVSSGLTGWVLYLGMWGIMMVAMMYPSSIPLLRLYYRSLNGIETPNKLLRLGAFLGTYTLIWTATGLIPLFVTLVVSLQSVVSIHETFLLGGTLVLLGGYQLSPYKYRCLKHCRSPLGFLMQSHQPGLLGAVQVSARHSVYCVGCCWALFAFMLVVGSMNIVWMAVITIVLSLERTVAWGERLAYAVGILSGVAGVALLLSAIL